MTIRAAIPADIPAMMALASESARAARWSAETYRRLLAGEGPARVALVLEDESATLCGFLVALCSGPEWEIENLAVAEAARRRRSGTRLLRELVDRAHAAGADSVFLEVRESNRAARALYESAAFVATGRRSAYYADPLEDAIVYRCKLE